MARKDIISAVIPKAKSLPKIPLTPLGSVGYDNSRDNIDPSVINLHKYLPIGSIIAWAKSITGVPQLLPGNFVECNGQVLSDDTSPLNGQTIPNLNGNNNFLRGSSTSGTTGGAATHSHTVTVDNDTHSHTASSASAGAHTHTGTTDSGGAHTHTGTTDPDTDCTTITAVSEITDVASCWHVHAFTTDSDGAHTHTFTTGSSGAHTHDITVDSDEHNHTASSGSSSSLPPYYEVVWIMRIK